MKVAIIGPVSSMEGLEDLHGKIDGLLGDGTVAEIKTRDFDGDTIFIPRGQPTSIPKVNRSKTGAAGIKRAAKQRRNRKR